MLYNVDRDGVTQSMLGDFVHCRQMCRYKLDGWESKDQNRSYANLGQLIHYGLELHYNKIIPTETKLYCFQSEEQSYSYTGAIEMEECLNKATVLLKEYISFYKQRDAKLKWIASEKELDIKGPCGVRLRGKIDGLFEIHKELWIMETKTTGQIAEQIESLVSYDFQAQVYAYAIEKILKRPVSGFVWNGIRTPQIRPCKGETKLAFMGRLTDDVHVRRQWYFVRYSVPFSKVGRAGFEEELGHKIAGFYRWIRGDDPTYKDQRSCRGRMYCEFIKMCATGDTFGYKRTRKPFRELKGDTNA